MNSAHFVLHTKTKPLIQTSNNVSIMPYGSNVELVFLTVC